MYLGVPNQPPIFSQSAIACYHYDNTYKDFSFEPASSQDEKSTNLGANLFRFRIFLSALLLYIGNESLFFFTADFEAVFFHSYNYPI